MRDGVSAPGRDGSGARAVTHNRKMRREIARRQTACVTAARLEFRRDCAQIGA